MSNTDTVQDGEQDENLDENDVLEVIVTYPGGVQIVFHVITLTLQKNGLGELVGFKWRDVPQTHPIRMRDAFVLTELDYIRLHETLTVCSRRVWSKEHGLLV